MESNPSKHVYSVTQVNRHVKSLISEDFILSGLWIAGEISNYKPHSSGHRYFTLKDDGGAISAVMFASDAASLTFEPENGQQVEAYGSVSLYEKTGQYQVYIRRMQPKGKGSLYEAFEALKAKLSAEGLFDASCKKPIPRYPRKVGLITSGTGAAVRDLISVSRRRFPGVKMVLYPALVQGDGAAASLVQGIRTLDALPEVDTIIIGRGGGSIEDLWAFNEEPVARAIFAAKTPIISAVGHETDFTISDFVADLRAATPSAAAELAVLDAEEELMGLDALKSRMGNAVRLTIARKRMLLGLQINRLKTLSPQARLNEWKLRNSHAREKMKSYVRLSLTERKNRLSTSIERLKLLDPKAPLAKGYAYLSDTSDKPIASVEGLWVSQKVKAVLKDGEVRLTVDSVSKENE